MQPLTISHIDITPFEIHLMRPFTFGSNTITARTGFYISVKTMNGRTGFGEIAPLPGISSETVRKARHDVEELKGYLQNAQFPIECKELVQAIKKNERLSRLCPSVRFGLESALFDLSAKIQGLSLEEYFEVKPVHVQSAVLLQGTFEQVIVEAKDAAAQGAYIFKLKVGDRNIPLDVKKVQDLRAVIGPQARIRLDANRVWSLSEAVLFAQLAGNAQIEYIEEPLSDISRINEFYHDTHMPIALDETLSVLKCGISAPGRCSPILALNEGVKAYIIKPMVLGGMIAALDWMEEAHANGKMAIISSSFETKVGMQFLKVLALKSQEVAGLGTERWFKNAQ